MARAPQEEPDPELQDIDELQESEKHPPSRSQGGGVVLLLGLTVVIVAGLLVVWFTTR